MLAATHTGFDGHVWVPRLSLAVVMSIAVYVVLSSTEETRFARQLSAHAIHTCHRDDRTAYIGMRALWPIASVAVTCALPAHYGSGDSRQGIGSTVLMTVRHACGLCASASVVTGA